MTNQSTIDKRECIDCVKDAACLLEKSVFS